MKGKSAKADNWTFHNQEFTTGEVQLAINYGLPKAMKDELDDHQEDYCSWTYEYWCDPLSTIEVEDESKRAAAQIKNISSARASFVSDSEDSASTPAAVLNSKNSRNMRIIATVYSAIVCFAIRYEYLRKSTCRIVTNIALVCAPTGPSRI